MVNKVSKLLVVALMLFSITACAAGTATQTASVKNSTSEEAASTVLRPYLGKWRPTSFKRALNIGSITVIETGFTIESGGSVAYELVTKTDEGVILRVTDRQPSSTHPEVTAFGFSLEMQTLKSFPPGGSSKTREMLRICYGFGSIDNATKQLASDMKRGRCPYTYIR